MSCQPQRTVSAGGLVFRIRHTLPELLIVVRTVNVEPKWAPVLRQLPKGRVECGETVEAAALREVREETGYETAIIRKAGVASWSYHRFGSLWHEDVHYFVMKLTSTIQGNRDEEFDRVEWLSVGDATDIISYPEERQIVHALRESCTTLDEMLFG